MSLALMSVKSVTPAIADSASFTDRFRPPRICSVRRPRYCAAQTADCPASREAGRRYSRPSLEVDLDLLR